MKVKVSDLTGAALDYAVAVCEGFEYEWQAASKACCSKANYSIDWSQGGPIIEREGITIVRCDDDYETDKKGYCTNKRIPVWAASIGQKSLQYSSFYQDDSNPQYEIPDSECKCGPTPLIAAMRCYVASEMGEEIEIPEEL